MSDPIGRCASTGPTCGRDDASAQLKNYAIAAGAVATAVGGVTGVSNAAIVTSSGSGPVWTGSVNAAGTQSNSAWDDAFLNNKFWAVVIQAGSTATGARYMTFQNFAGRVHVGRLSTGAVIGATGSSLFDLPQGLVKVRSNGGSNAGWSAQPQTNMTSWSFGTSNAVRGFLAFRLGSTGQFNYGYFDLEFTRSSIAPGSTFAMTVHGWAYESTANQSITISGAAAVPGGTGLAALAVGAAGVRGRRRKPA